MTDIEFQRHWNDLERYLRSDAAARVQAKAWLARLFRQLGDPLPEAAPVGDDDPIVDLPERIAAARARALETVRQWGDRTEEDDPAERFRVLMACEESRTAANRRRKAKLRAAREATR